MSADTIAALRANPELYKRFKDDPLSTIEELCEMTGSDTPRRLTAGEIAMLRDLTPEEFELLYSLIDRMGTAGVTNFKLLGASGKTSDRERP
jgi:hypothetical protein